MEKSRLLKQYFGHSAFRDGQEELIDNLVKGNDVMGIMPTGAGKSVCYQIPALMLEGTAIVISPLISLMKDQVNSLTEVGISAAFLNSSLAQWEYYDVLNQAELGRYKILYVAPERLGTENFIDFAKRVKISLVIIDEAHCVSQWGQDFRPSYLKIADFISALPKRPVVGAFTATATKQVRDDIINILRLKKPYIVTTGFDRKNLYFEVRKPKDKTAELLKLMERYKNQSGIVYCISRKSVEEVCERLCEEGYDATRYHAGLSDNERRINQEDFIFDRKRVMVATNAFGMGIDKSNVSFVIHYNMPKNIESYYQEAGRAGRDGAPAECVLLYGKRDVRSNEFLIDKMENSELDEEQAEQIKELDRKRLKQMTFYSTTSDCLRQFMLKYFGEKAPDHCGNCSNCNAGYEMADITVEAQKIVSCVYRLEQRNRHVGASTIVEILRGSRSCRMAENGYDTLSTFGIMRESNTPTIRRIVDFLIRENYLAEMGEEFHVIRMTEKSRSVIKPAAPIKMKIPIIEEKPKEEKPQPVNDSLLDKLKKLRLKIANSERVPAYVIFTDAALMDMCRKLPKTRAEFLSVSGVGEVKLNKYGEKFMEVIKQWEDEQ
ncbi:MAG: DNA helicase RecQ [Ruminiclostridium sp.]